MQAIMRVQDFFSEAEKKEGERRGRERKREERGKERREGRKRGEREKERSRGTETSRKFISLDKHGTLLLHFY